ncbi:hypothetical protein EP1X_08590 [Thermococcus sp. EP1]|uniref:DUF257 family protein n=1 Tax=Thermococcus sp. EP1 TaxID=1591054 RepID=UPI0006D9C8D9|nr:DUF257 family protein [Thermococcus sp. EP1]KPU62502.1 hypothetical protein EP1X_08590 [Thermococcus sp. EP1]
MWEILDKIKPGEIVLVEYSSNMNPTRILHDIIKWAKSKEYQVLITDMYNLVELHTYRMKMEGLDMEVLKWAKIIEIGRHEPSVGEVIKFIPVDRELLALLAEYKEVYEEFVSKNFTVVLFFGLERYMLFKNEVMSFVSILERFLGDTRRISIYFVNRDVLTNISPDPLPLLEELATTIMKFQKEAKKIKFTINKALNPELEGYEECY